MAPRTRHKSRRQGDVQRSYRFRLYPSDEQAVVMTRYFVGCRWLWNQAVQHHRLAYRAGAAKEPLITMKQAIPPARRFEGSPLVDVPGTWAQGTLLQLEDGWQLYWSKRKAGTRSRPPAFRSARRAQSVRFAVQQNRGPATPDYLVKTTDTGSIRFSLVRITKVGWVRARIDRPLPDDALIGSMVVRKDELGNWWVVFQADVPTPERTHTGVIVGVGRGTSHSLVTDTGRTFDAPGLTEGEIRRRRKLERSLVRSRRINACPVDQEAGTIRRRCVCEPGSCWKQSKRYAHTSHALAKLRAREAQRTDDATHKASTVMARIADVVVFETPQVETTTSPATGDDEPGSTVSQKRDLNDTAPRQVWGEVRRKTTYKTTVIVLDPDHTSQTCAECGHINQTSSDTQTSFGCTACGHQADTDFNAARNIKQRGIDAMTSGDDDGNSTRGSAPARGVEGQGRDRPERPDELSTVSTEQTRTPQHSNPVTALSQPLVPTHWGVATRRRRAGP